MNSIRGRLLLGFGLVVALALTTALVGFFSNQGLSKDTRKLAELSTDLGVGSQSQQAVLMVRMNVKDFLLTNTQKEIDEYEQWRSTFEAKLKASEEAFQNPRRVAWLAEIREKISAYDQAWLGVKATIAERNEIRDQKLSPNGKKILEKIAALETMVEEAGDTSTVLAIQQLREIFWQVRYYSRASITQPNQHHHDRLAQTSSACADALKALEAKLTTDPQRALYAKIVEHRHAFLQLSERANELVAQRNHLVLETLDILGPQIAGLWDEVTTSLIEDSQTIADQAENSATSAGAMVLAAGAISLFLGLGLAVLIARSVVKPIDAVVARIKDIAEGEGDLTQRVDESRKDEMGELGQWFNIFVTKVNNIIVAVKDATDDVAAAATEIAANGEEMAQSLDSQTQSASAIVKAIDEIAISVTDTAKNAMDAAQRATEAGERATEGREIVGQTIGYMDSINTVVSSSANAIQDLGQRAESIGEIVKVINEIADQTNLLALNAAIESARAGEHGRGFAVVADEVRKLADRTSKATEEIADSITLMQQETDMAVDGMNSGRAQMDTGVKAAENAGQSIDGIVEGSQEVAGFIQQIAAAAEEQSATGAQVRDVVAEMNEAIQQSAAGATQSASAVQELSVKAEQLRDMVSAFKLRARDRRQANRGPRQGSERRYSVAERVRQKL